MEACKEIEKGNSVSIQPQSGDEIGEAHRSFVAMGHRLEEPEKLKETFGKFVNKEIANRYQGETARGGARRSQSSSRTSLLHGNPETRGGGGRGVQQYMTRMVNCVNVTNGVVDKYIGDAIMAVQRAHILRHNTANAINGALMM